MDPLMPPPVRRIVVDREPHVAPPRPRRRGERRPRARGGRALRGRAPRAAAGRRVSERMRIESVWLAYGENWVVRDVSLPVRQGEVLALIGASGSGKTTLLRSLNRLTEITDGRRPQRADHARRHGHPRARGQRAAPARLDGLPAAQPVPDEHLRQRRLRARRAAPARGRRGGGARPSSSSAVDRRAAARRPLRGGRRRPRPLGAADSPAASSSACASRARWRRGPEVLLLDEPCSALDPISTATIEELIVRPARERRDRDRHAQPAAGLPRGRPRRVHAPRRARRVRHAASRCSTARASSARATTSAGPSGESGWRSRSRSPPWRWPGCETTAEEERAAGTGGQAQPRISRSHAPRAGSRSRAPSSERAGAARRRVVHSAEGTAAVVTLRNRLRPTLATGPARDRRHATRTARSLYTNNQPGLATHARRRSPLDPGPRHGRPGSTTRSRRRRRRRRQRPSVGEGPPAARQRSRRIAVSGARIVRRTRRTATAPKERSTNRSAVAQQELVVYAVAPPRRRGSSPPAARSLPEAAGPRLRALPGCSSIGSPAGAQLQRAAPRRPLG